MQVFRPVQLVVLAAEGKTGFLLGAFVIYSSTKPVDCISLIEEVTLMERVTQVSSSGTLIIVRMIHIMHTNIGNKIFQT